MNCDQQSGLEFKKYYDKEGNVDYLYRGRFSNGQPNDMTGKAWMIGQDWFPWSDKLLAECRK